jgi:hypothetical protein
MFSLLSAMISDGEQEEDAHPGTRISVVAVVSCFSSWNIVEAWPEMERATVSFECGRLDGAVNSLQSSTFRRVQNKRWVKGS